MNTKLDLNRFFCFWTNNILFDTMMECVITVGRRSGIECRHWSVLRQTFRTSVDRIREVQHGRQRAGFWALLGRQNRVGHGKPANPAHDQLQQPEPQRAGAEGRPAPSGGQVVVVERRNRRRQRRGIGRTQRSGFAQVQRQTEETVAGRRDPAIGDRVRENGNRRELHVGQSENYDDSVSRSCIRCVRNRAFHSYIRLRVRFRSKLYPEIQNFTASCTTCKAKTFPDTTLEDTPS